MSLSRAFLSSISPPAHTRKLSWLVWGGLLYLAFVWPVPNGMLPFHRNLPLYLVSIGLLWLWSRQPTGQRAALLDPLRPIGWLILALSLWILLTGILHSGQGFGYFRTFNGKWLRMLQLGLAATLLLPLLLGQAKLTIRGPVVFFCLIVAMWLVPLLQSLDVLYLWLSSGDFPWQTTRLAYSRMELSVHINLLSSFLFAELAARLVMGKRWLPVNMSCLLGMLAICLFSGMALATRNASIGLVAMVASTTLLVLLFKVRDWGWPRLLLGLLLGFSLLATIVTVSIKSDDRWQSFMHTVPLAWDTEHYLSWRDSEEYPFPQLADGSRVINSNYERLAWIKIGLQLIAKQPLGQGIAGDNFHRLIERYYGPSKTTSQAHSGVINFALANGIPGILMWFCLLGWLIRQGFRAFYQQGNVAGLFLLMFVFGMMGRSLIDDVLRDHMLEMFFFFSALLLRLCCVDSQPAVSTGQADGLISELALAATSPDSIRTQSLRSCGGSGSTSHD